MSVEDAKREAAARAVARVEDGMRLGLGTGSTAKHCVALLGERVRGGLNVIGVPTSERTRAQAEAEGIPLSDLDATPELDLTVDGADEIDEELRLIKGGGGALLREKIVAAASARMIVIADDSKRVAVLGRYPLPIEVVSFGLGATKLSVRDAAAGAGCRGDLRLRREKDGSPFVTDGGHYILDGAFGAIPDPETLSRALLAVPGVVDHGLFIGFATAAIVASPHGISTYGDFTRTRMVPRS